MYYKTSEFIKTLDCEVKIDTTMYQLTLLQCLYVVKLKRFVGLIYVPGTLNIKMIVNVATLVYLKDRMGHEMN